MPDKTVPETWTVSDYSEARTAAISASLTALRALRQDYPAGEVQIGCVIDSVERVSSALKFFFLEAEPAMRTGRVEGL